MPLRHLDKLFQPASIAVIGASARPGKVGTVVMQNLLKGGFAGPIMPVNPKHRAVSGVLTYPDLQSLPIAPDLGVVCTPPATIPAIIDNLCEAGTKAAIVLSSGLSDVLAEDGRSVRDVVLEKARAQGMRLLGPNCLGIMVPRHGLNASFMHTSVTPGKIAFVSQSGSMCSGVLDWASAHGIGFSHFISLGEATDLDFGDIIDYLGSDPFTRAILLYIETIHERRNFMSAARAAARNKPILVVKAGRATEGARAAAYHTRSLTGADDVFDAAIRRAGMLRVETVAELFAAAETLGRYRPIKKDRLAVLSNGGGIGVLAVDALDALGGTLARFSDETKHKLAGILHLPDDADNPTDLSDDADGTRYATALEILSAAPEVDGVLVIHAPSALASSTEIAEKVVEAAAKSKKQMLTCWVGERSVGEARDRFNAAGLPTFTMPHLAVAAFMHLVQYQRNQELLMECPPAAPQGFSPDRETVRRMVNHAIAQGRESLTEPESKAVLNAYGIPTVLTAIAPSPEDAVKQAESIGYPVALKVISPDIAHKARVGGVRLNLETPEAVRQAAKRMGRTIAARAPAARVDGFSVQAMASRSAVPELVCGITTDPLFGPVIVFGQGGSAVEEIADRAVGLPPLNMHLASELVGRTRVSALLKSNGMDEIDRNAVLLTLTRLSQLVVDNPEIIEADINPLTVHSMGVLALDARIRVAMPKQADGRRLAIRPYPEALEEKFALRDGRASLLRPIRPEDEPKHYEFLSKLTPEDIRFRFFGLVGELPHDQMARLTQIDYDREMAFVAKALEVDADGKEYEAETLGVVRTVTDSNNERAEYAIVVRSDLKGQKLGWKLLDKMIDYCRSRGTKFVVGQILAENRPMLDLVRAMGFVSRRVPGEGIMEVELDLEKPVVETQRR